MNVSDPTPEQVLNLPIAEDHPSGAATVRDYLITLLVRLWTQGSDFSSKRPFGTTDWPFDLYIPLIKAGFIAGELNEDDYIEDCADDAGDRLIVAAIRSLGVADS
jgi:hypothetical protein